MVEARHITMDFRIDQNRTTNLKEFVVDALHRQTHTTTFRALDDVSFTAEKGSVTGLIGHNGAGKSTLLKIISGIYPPTSGSVTLQGTLVPMLELGSGFDAELTGRENISPQRRNSWLPEGFSARQSAGNHCVQRTRSFHRPPAENVLVRNARASGVLHRHRRSA